MPATNLLPGGPARIRAGFRLPIRCGLFLVFVLWVPPARAQVTTPEPLLVPYPLPALQHGSVDFGDVDGDGDLDLLFTGQVREARSTRVYRLEDSLFVLSAGGFSLEAFFKVYRELPIIVNQVFRGEARWNDYDGDGDGDFILTGIAEVDVGVDLRVEEPITELYAFRAADAVFVQDNRSAFPGVHSGAVAWGDYDGDGDPDLALAGATRLTAPFNPITRLYRNDGNGRFTDVQAGLPGVMLGALAWADYDGDGDLDLALMGETDGAFLTRLYRNDGDDRFHDAGTAFPPLAFGGLAWGDYDGDGDPDLALTGATLDPGLLRGVSKLFRNDGGAFSEAGVSLPGVALGGVQWGDYDGDGDLDLFLSGAESTLGARHTFLFRNDGGAFSKELQLAGLAFGDLAVGDYNDDGDLDFLTIGANEAGIPFTLFFMNRIFPELLPADLFRR